MAYKRKSPVLDGYSKRCGNCGRGELFKSYLKFHDECSECGQSFAIADTADGPSFFVGFLALIIFVPLFVIGGLVPKTTFGLVATLSIMFVVMIGAILWLLPIVKGILFNLQVYHRAEEGKLKRENIEDLSPKP